LAGFVGIHAEGSCGILFVDEKYRGMGIGASLEAFIINTVKNNGFIPFGQVVSDNTVSLHMQERFGLNISETPLWWLDRS